jgi:CHASE1-domain containing sensor protein
LVRTSVFASAAASLSRRWLASLLALVIGGGLSTAALLALRGAESRTIEDEVRRIAERRALVLDEELEDAIASVRAVRELHGASVSPDRDEFKLFTADLLAASPALEAVGWVPRVPKARRGAYEASARRDGIQSFRFTEETPSGALVPAQRRDVYYPVYFVEPRAGNAALLGFDFASSMARLSALSRARDTGRSAVSSQVALVQTGEPGFLVFVPVYRPGAPLRTVEERRRALDGFAVGVISAEGALARALAAYGSEGI